MTKDRLWTLPFITMGSINFIQFITQYILVTTLPLLILSVFGGSQVEAGLAMTFFQVGTSIFRPIAGYIIDKKNKRWLLIIALLIFSSIMTAFNFLYSLEEIYSLRFLHGILFSIITTTAAAMAVLIIPASRRGEGIGYFSVTTNLAMVVGPLLGLILYQQISALALFLVLTATAVLSLVMAVTVSLPKEILTPSTAKKDGSLLARFIEKRSLPASLLGGLVFFAYGGILTFISLYAESLHLADKTGLFFAIFALAIVLSRPIVGHLFDRAGATYIVYPGFIFFIIGLIMFSQALSQAAFLMSAAILGLGFGALSPAFQTLAIVSVPAERAGAATATYFWMLDIFIGLAAAVFGVIAQIKGYAFMYGIVSPIILLIAAAAYFYLHRKKAI